MASAQGTYAPQARAKAVHPRWFRRDRHVCYPARKYLGAKVGTTTSTGNVDLVRSLGADEVIDYKKQEFEEVLRDYDAVLGAVRGDALEKSLRILKPRSTVVSPISP